MHAFNGRSLPQLRTLATNCYAICESQIALPNFCEGIRRVLAESDRSLMVTFGGLRKQSAAGRLFEHLPMACCALYNCSSYCLSTLDRDARRLVRHLLVDEVIDGEDLLKLLDDAAALEELDMARPYINYTRTLVESILQRTRAPKSVHLLPEVVMDDGCGIQCFPFASLPGSVTSLEINLAGGCQFYDIDVSHLDNLHTIRFLIDGNIDTYSSARAIL